MSDDYPIRTKGHQTDEKGQAILKIKTPEEWHITFFGVREYGTDFKAEIPLEGKMKGITFKGQLKSHGKPMSINKDNTISQPVKYKNWNNWQTNQLFILIVVDIATDKIYWLNIKKYKIDRIEGQDGTTVRIPITNEITNQSSIIRLVYEIFKSNGRSEKEYDDYVNSLFMTFFSKKAKKSYHIKENYHIDPFYYITFIMISISIFFYYILLISSTVEYPIFLNVAWLTFCLVLLKMIVRLRDNYKSKLSVGFKKYKYIFFILFLTVFLILHLYYSFYLFLQNLINLGIFSLFALLGYINYRFLSKVLNHQPNPKAYGKVSLNIEEL